MRIPTFRALLLLLGTVALSSCSLNLERPFTFNSLGYGSGIIYQKAHKGLGGSGGGRYSPQEIINCDVIIFYWKKSRPGKEERWTYCEFKNESGHHGTAIPAHLIDKIVLVN